MTTNRERERMLADLGQNLLSTALLLRATTPVVSGCLAVLDAQDELHMAVIPQHLMPERISLITQMVRHLKGIAFVLAFDGYYSHFDAKHPCASCRGTGCEICRGTGGTLTARYEAVQAVVRTRWGFTHHVKQCYEEKGGAIVRVDVADVPDGGSVTMTVDPYESIFGHGPRLVH